MKRLRSPTKGAMKVAKVRSGFEGGLQKERQRSTGSCVEPGFQDLGSGSKLLYRPDFFAETSMSTMMAQLQEEVTWQQQEISVMGRKVMQPRLVAYMADAPSLSYTYSKTKQEPLPWSPTVKKIKEKVEALTELTFNSCLLNLYRNGNDSLSWHSDNEKVYGPQPSIASVSFGGRREFILRNNEQRQRRLVIDLGGSGDVLVMYGNCQLDWQHSLPKRKNLNEPRINLTFRQIKLLERD